MSMHKNSAVTLDFAQEAFRGFPNNETAGMYLRALLEYMSDDMIGDDTFFNGLAAIEAYLSPATKS